MRQRKVAARRRRAAQTPAAGSGGSVGGTPLPQAPGASSGGTAQPPPGAPPGAPAPLVPPRAPAPVRGRARSQVGPVIKVAIAPALRQALAAERSLEQVYLTSVVKTGQLSVPAQRAAAAVYRGGVRTLFEGALQQLKQPQPQPQPQPAARAHLAPADAKLGRVWFASHAPQLVRITQEVWTSRPLLEWLRAQLRQGSGGQSQVLVPGVGLRASVTVPSRPGGPADACIMHARLSGAHGGISDACLLSALEPEGALGALGLRSIGDTADRLILLPWRREWDGWQCPIAGASELQADPAHPARVHRLPWPAPDESPAWLTELVGPPARTGGGGKAADGPQLSWAAVVAGAGVGPGPGAVITPAQLHDALAAAQKAAREADARVAAQQAAAEQAAAQQAAAKQAAALQAAEEQAAAEQAAAEQAAAEQAAAGAPAAPSPAEAAAAEAVTPVADAGAHEAALAAAPQAATAEGEGGLEPARSADAATAQTAAQQAAVQTAAAEGEGGLETAHDADAAATQQAAAQTAAAEGEGGPELPARGADDPDLEDSEMADAYKRRLASSADQAGEADDAAGQPPKRRHASS